MRKSTRSKPCSPPAPTERMALLPSRPTAPHSSFAQLVTFIYCTDLREATTFWRDTLGLPVVLDQVAPAPDGGLKCRIFGVAPTGYIGAVLSDPASKAGTGVSADGVTITLAVPTRAEVDRWAERLTSAGVALEKPPTLNTRYNIYHIFFRDPDQHLCEVQAFLDPLWPSAPPPRRRRAGRLARHAAALLAAAAFGALVGRRLPM